MELRRKIYTITNMEFQVLLVLCGIDHHYGILVMEEKIEDKVNKKDTEKREFNWKLVGGISFALMTVAGISASVLGGKFDFKKYVEYVNGEILKGFQLRYVYFIDKRCKEKLTVPIIPFSKIDEIGAGMYKGEKVTQSERHNKKQPE